MAFLGLTLVTVFGLSFVMARVLAGGGFTGFEMAMLGFFAVNTPWLAIGFWNAVIGVLLLHCGRAWLPLVLPIAGVTPSPPEGAGEGGGAGVGADEDVGAGAGAGAGAASSEAPLTGRIAIVAPIFNEDPAQVIRHLRTIAVSLAHTGEAAAFEIFWLSDSNRPDILEAEERLFAEWRAGEAAAERLHYRRRHSNQRQKVGNIEDFCTHHGDRFDYMIVLDADSLMSGAAILRLVRLMEANPRLGIVQSLVTGLPSNSAFARIFQFGMRHGMRVYATGAAWWQGDEGPYWGHNAIIRLAPFRRFCRLPSLPRTGPLGGDILSHDQVEAVLMRRAGFHVRVLPLEGGSYEANPPTVQDFMKRDLRWCQGNLQYLRLLSMPGLRRLGRLQLLLAIMMYAAAPFWYAFMLTGLAHFAWQAWVFEPLYHAYADMIPPVPGSMSGLGIGLFVTVIGMNFAPKILSVIDVLLRREERLRYGGAGMLAAGAMLEAVFSALLAPVAALAQVIFIAGLPFGRRISWQVQGRAERGVSWREAVSGLWPQTLVGLFFAVGLYRLAPEIFLWGLPVILSLICAIPFAVISAAPWLGRALARAGWCAIPEERHPPPELQILHEAETGGISHPGQHPSAAATAPAATAPAATADADWSEGHAPGRVAPERG